MDIHKLLARMWERRTQWTAVACAQGYTLSYAVSTRTGRCYVGWNGPFSHLGVASGPRSEERQERWQTATGRYLYAGYTPSSICAEASALSVALSYSEQLGSLIFFVTNSRGEPFQPCENCQDWICPQARGCLKTHEGSWFIQIYGPSLTNPEKQNLETAAQPGSQDLDWFRANVRVNETAPTQVD